MRESRGLEGVGGAELRTVTGFDVWSVSVVAGEVVRGC